MLCKALADEEYMRKLVANAVWGNPPGFKSRADIEYRVLRLLSRIALLQAAVEKELVGGKVGTEKETKD